MTNTLIGFGSFGNGGMPGGPITGVPLAPTYVAPTTTRIIAEAPVARRILTRAQILAALDPSQQRAEQQAGSSGGTMISSGSAYRPTDPSEPEAIPLEETGARCEPPTVGIWPDCVLVSDYGPPTAELDLITLDDKTAIEEEQKTDTKNNYVLWGAVAVVAGAGLFMLLKSREN